MTTEKIVVNSPGAGPQVLDVEVNASDGDDDIARRLARSFPVGTILGVCGTKWRVISQDPAEVREVGAAKSESRVRAAVAEFLADPEVPEEAPSPWDPEPAGTVERGLADLLDEQVADQLAVVDEPQEEVAAGQDEAVPLAYTEYMENGGKRAEAGDAVLTPADFSEMPPREPVLVSVKPVLGKLLAARDQGPQPGERWRPRDPRRKQSGFLIRAVTSTEVIADDGRKVSLERLKRYERVS